MVGVKDSMQHVSSDWKTVRLHRQQYCWEEASNIWSIFLDHQGSEKFHRNCLKACNRLRCMNFCRSSKIQSTARLSSSFPQVFPHGCFIQAPDLVQKMGDLLRYFQRSSFSTKNQIPFVGPMLSFILPFSGSFVRSYCPHWPLHPPLTPGFTELLLQMLISTSNSYWLGRMFSSSINSSESGLGAHGHYLSSVVVRKLCGKSKAVLWVQSVSSSEPDQMRQEPPPATSSVTALSAKKSPFASQPP